MILFLILALTLLFLIVFTVFAVAAGGSIAIVLFSDVIVCIAIIAWIIKKIVQKKE